MTLHEGAAPLVDMVGFDCEFGINLRILLRRKLGGGGLGAIGNLMAGGKFT
jgi:hypothetical protein